MCEVCLHVPCRPGCPNQTEEEAARCFFCREPLYEGDAWAECSKGALCRDCMESLPLRQLLPLLDVSSRGF